MSKTDIKKLKNLINRTKHELKWKVIDSRDSNCDSFYIISNPSCKTHEILYPQGLDSSAITNSMDYLHELCHAILAEQIHHQFGVNMFYPGTPDESMTNVAAQCKAASDWFVDAHLYKIAPELFKQELERDLRVHLNALNISQRQVWNSFNCFGCALLFAESIKWLKLPLSTDGIYKAIIDVFMAVDPTKPTLSNLVQLINNLLAIQSDYVIELVIVEELQIEVYQINDKRCVV